MAPPATSASANTVIGSWGPTFALPLIAIHATALPNESGKVLLFSSRSSTAGSAAWLWDAATGALRNVSVTYSHDMMCGGNTLLADGTVFVTGGRISAYKTSIFNPATDTWHEGPSMSLSRYYPSAIELPDGKVLIFYGRSSTVDSYDPETNTITPLPPSANRDAALYPRLHLLTDGRLFHAGPEQQTSIFDPATSTWSPMGQMTYGERSNGSTVLLPGLNKVLTFGGSKGSGPTNTAEIIDFSQAIPHWRPTASMHLDRQHENGVLLPDGTVLAVGGRGGGTVPKQAEIFDPVTETWTITCSIARPAARASCGSPRWSTE